MRGASAFVFSSHLPFVHIDAWVMARRNVAFLLVKNTSGGPQAGAAPPCCGCHFELVSDGVGLRLLRHGCGGLCGARVCKVKAGCCFMMGHPLSGRAPAGAEEVGLPDGVPRCAGVVALP